MSSFATLDWLGCLMWLRGRVVPLLAPSEFVDEFLDDISSAAICLVTVLTEAMSFV